MTPNAAGRDARIDEAIAEFLESSPDPAAWLTKHAELRPELESFLADRAAFVRAAEPVNPMTVGFDEPSTGNSSPLGTVCYFGDYELLSEIARGGMGVVYKARQASLNRVVALKMIVKGVLASPEDVRRFRTEAEAAALLDHPNIVPIYEVGEHDGQQYFAMKYVEGQTLTALRRSSPGRTNIRSAVAVLSQVARAVQYAHQRGILHRDLKPGNVLLDRSGIPYVTDFGLAKRVEGEATLTQSGAVVGTPSYMAPEQARAERQLTTAADVWSLGAVLYELSAGRPPFRADGMMATLKLVLESEPPRPRSLNPLVDRDLETVILRCLEKEPAKRYGSAEALADDLDRWLRGEPVQARRVTAWERGWKWAKRRPAVAGLLAACVVLLLAGSVVSWWLTLDARLARDASRERARESRRLLNTLSLEQGWTAEQDGDVFRALLWYAEPLNDSDLDPAEEEIVRRRLGMYLRHVSWHTPHLEFTLDESLLSIGKIEAPIHVLDFSPDGRRLVCLTSISEGATSYPAFEILDVATGRVVVPPKRHAAIGQCVRYCPDGRCLATAGDNLIQLWDALSGQPIGPTVNCEKNVYDLTFSPDGKWLVPSLGELTVDGSKVTREQWRSQYLAGFDLPVFRVRAGLEKAMALHHSSATCVRQVTFCPKSQRLATVGDGWWNDGVNRRYSRVNWQAHLWNVSSELQQSSVQQSNKQLEIKGTNDGGAPAERATQVMFSADGRHLIVSTRAGGLVWDVESKPVPGQLLDGEDSLEYTAFGPDGKTIVTAASDSTVRIRDLQNGRQLGPSIRTRRPAQWMAFAPDRRTIWTISNLGGSFRAWDSVTARPLAPVLPKENAFNLGAGVEALVSPLENAVVFPRGSALEMVRFDAVDRRPRKDLLLLVQLFSGSTLRNGRPEPLTDDECRAGWEHLRSGYPNVFTIPVEDCLRWHQDRSDAALERKHQHLALFAANQDIIEYPDRCDGYVFRGRVNTVMKRWNDAASDFEQVVRLGGAAWIPPELNGDVVTCVSFLYPAVVEKERYEEALALAELANRFAPSHASRAMLGAAQYRNGQFKAAAETLTSLVASPQSRTADSLAFLAMAHQRLGQSTESRTRLSELRSIMRGDAELRKEAENLIEGRK